MNTVTEIVYHDYPYLPFMESFLKILKLILGILGVFAWCFLCLGIFGIAIYLYEKMELKKNERKENKPRDY